GWYSFDQPVIMARFDQPKPEHESATSKFEPVTVTVLAGQMSLILDGQVGIRFLSSDLSKSSLAFIGLNAVLDAEGKPLSPDNVRVAVNDQLQIISSTGDRYHLKVTSELGDRITLLITQASK
ncbi:MAG TPA: hypothetical protein VNN76_10770, partial [Bacteroidota bacterium]|nr:hypothetical protein [Bacteroidota bacterium]